MQNYFKELQRGVLSYRDAWEFMKEHSLWRYLIIPGVVSALYAAGFWFMNFSTRDSLLAGAEGSWEWYQNAVTWLVENAYWPFMLWFFFASFKYVILILLSPLMSQLSDKVEQLSGGPPAQAYSMKQMIGDMKRAVKLGMRNFVWETVICLLLIFVPVASTVLIFLVGSFYAGFGYMDYTLERKRLDVDGSIVVMRRHRGLTLGLGIVFQLGMLVPFAGWVLMPTFATLASTRELILILPEADYSSENPDPT